MTVGFKRFYNLQLTDHVVTTFTNHRQFTHNHCNNSHKQHDRPTSTLLQITKPSCTNQRVIIVIKGEI
jgi:hypothetical protein